MEEKREAIICKEILIKLIVIQSIYEVVNKFDFYLIYNSIKKKQLFIINNIKYS
jgi:hypothetical protein